jgi:thymidylate kinase
LKSVLITFSGIDGAGKSTQIDKLRDYLNQQRVPVSVLAFWDHVALFPSVRSGFSRRVLQSDGAIGTPERPADRRDKNTQSFVLILGRCVLHLLDVFSLRRRVREAQAQNTGVIIFDRYIYDQVAALPLSNSWFPRAYARLLLSIAPKPDLSYLLDAVPEVARARKPEYPLEFMRQYRNSYLELRKMAHLELIAAADVEDVHAAILTRFEKSRINLSVAPQVDSAVIA